MTNRGRVEPELKILIVEDNPADAELMVRELHRGGIRCSTRLVDNEQGLRRELDQFAPNIILSDFSMPGFDGLAALAAVKEKRPDIPFIFVSGTIGEEKLIEALKSGAKNYVLKTNLRRLAPSVQQALREEGQRAARKRAELNLLQEKNFSESLINSLPGIYYLIDERGKILRWNRHFQEMSGYTGAEIAQANPSDFVAEEDKALSEEKMQEALAKGESAVEVRLLSKSGKKTPFYLTASRIKIDNTAYLTGVGIDITERKKQEQKIARLNRIYSVLSGINSAIVRIRDRQQLFEEACRIAVEHGKFRMAWIGVLPPGANLVVPLAWAGHEDGYLKKIRVTTLEDEPGSYSAGGQALRLKRSVVCNNIAQDTQLAPWQKDALERGYQSLVGLPLVVGDEAIGVMGLYAAEPDFFDKDEMELLTELAGDISFALQYIEKEEKLKYLAYYDTVTGLPNRALCYDRLNQNLQAARIEGTRAAVAFVDIERFREINESLSRHGGDALLKQVGERLTDSLGSAASVGRIAADWFAATITNVRKDAEIADVIEQKIFLPLNQPFKVSGQELRIAVKVGVALSPHDGDDAETLFRNAEAALNRTKTSGERYLFYAPEMNARVTEKLALENKLRVALEKQQFVLHYQPKVDLASRQVSGLEALIRWQDPETGLVPPMKFIPLLEETGMILDAGYWAISQASADHRRWSAKGLNTRIAVNVSPIQLRRKDFVDTIRRAVAEQAVDAQNLDLEITESLIMQNIEDNIRKLKALREMGVGIAIDDFGTGYSSLGYLAKLPVNALKIDRAFIVNMVQDPDSMTIVSTIISLAHSLNLKVIAEGVDSEEQSKFLGLLKCDEMQGFLFSRPVPFDKIETILKENRALK
ncbi:MAG TPA: EAL domain-containing protein [Burkholderiales bacterium]|nr:EAL domain-containing protein [Burkholderiales bacterium]